MDEAGTVRLTPAGTLLRSDQPGSLARRISHNVTSLPGARSRKRCAAALQLRIANGTKTFDSMSGDADALETFDEHMRMRAMQMYRSLFPFLLRRGAEDVVDLAGGTGGLSELLLEGSEASGHPHRPARSHRTLPPDLSRLYGHDSA